MTEHPPPGETPRFPPPLGEPPWAPPQQQPPPGPHPGQPPHYPPSRSSGAVPITFGVLTGVVAWMAAAATSFGLLYDADINVALAAFGPFAALVVFGVVLAVPAATRRFGLPFLITVSIGFVIAAGVCTPLLAGSW